MKENTLLKSSILLLIFLSLTGCATPYQPKGLRGGYTEMQLNKNTYRVNFSGNGNTSADLTQNYALRRSAELTLNKGYKYFVVRNDNTRDNREHVRTPTTVETHTVSSRHHGSRSYTTVQPGSEYTVDNYTSSVTIKMYRSKQNHPRAYDAAVILSNYKK